MSMPRRGWLRRRDLPAVLAPLLLGTVPAGRAYALQRRVLSFPRDHGAHPDARTEWWYITGALEAADGAGGGAAALYGWQITFFRWRSEVAADHPSAFAAKQIVFAHAAITDVAAGRLVHDARIARRGFGIADYALDDTRLVLHDWSLAREGLGAVEGSGSTGEGDGSVDASGRYRAIASARGFALDLTLQPTQPPLLQGDAGWSRKGPLDEQASHYVSVPQLASRGTITLHGRRIDVRGRAWLDHEWSDAYLAREADGWDWIGMNLDDGSALMAFRIRRPDGSALWAGGSFRRAGGEPRSFAAGEVRFTPGRTWSSAATRAVYPVQWSVETPAGRFEVRALADAQELDSRSSTGTAYWEGLSELLDAGGRRVGRGYLEMTGYAGKLRM